MKEISELSEKSLRIILLTGLFVMVWVMNLVLFRYSFINLTFFTYSLFNFIVVFIIYYALSKIITSIRSPIKWVVLILAFVSLSLLARYVLNFPLKYMVGIYPDDKLLMYVYEYFNIHSLKNLFNYTTQIFLIYKLYIHLVLFFVASMLLKYTQSLKRISELRVINANQELDLLKSQIHPHFLFNTLNNLYRLVMDNDKAGEVVLKLSETLRFNLYEANKKAIPIKMEIKFLKNYIELEKINHGSKVDIRYDFREIINIESFIAPMILFSFVDHVLKYGVNKSMENSLVQIKLKQSKQSLFFQITNCVPITPNNLSLHELGLSNIKKRLDILYPDKYKLVINEDKINYKVNLTLNL